MELLEVIGKVKQAIRGGYHPDIEREIEDIRHMLVSGRSPKEWLALPYSIFIPQIQYYPQCRREFVKPPKRWEEPKVQQYIRRFQSLMETEDTACGRASVERDFVYQHILNVDLRRKIETRTMKQKEYEYLTSKLEASLPKLLPSTLTALEAVKTGVARYQAERYYNQITNGLLSAESGLTENVVKRYEDRGMSGSQIVDMGCIIKSSGTNSQLAKKLIDRGVDGWQDLIEASRETGCSVTMILKLMEHLQTKEADNIIGLLDESQWAVKDYAYRKHKKVHVAWWVFFSILTSSGHGDATLTIDLLENCEGVD